MSSGKRHEDVDLEWEKRILCSDESCIGTIGPDGRCRECGRRYEGTLPNGFASSQTDETAQSETGITETEAAPRNPETDENPESDDQLDEASADAVDDEWERRTLCPDESCIGVIGPDGLCKECGKSI